MFMNVIRIVFVIACVVIGAFWAKEIPPILTEGEAATGLQHAIMGGLLGGGLASMLVFGLRFVSQDLFERLAPVIASFILAIVTGYGLAHYFIYYLKVEDTFVILLNFITVVIVFVFVGVMLGISRASNWEHLLRAVDKRNYRRGALKLVDTSVLIDGRISDIATTGFLEGALLVPRFVLHELQRIADSPDELRRARGRRGLDIIKQLQDPKLKLDIEIIEDDPKDVKEVDAKLVRLARIYDAKVMTNDLNLNKVAQIEGVPVMNINDLANALKPAVLPDEAMRIKIVKEGKEAFQGVGYLDDGTMVVVDGGKDHIGQDVSVLVTSVLQTTAGRMIFSRLQEVLS